MSSMSLRLPDYLHKSARKLAKQEHISVNQLVSTALAEKLAALGTEEYLDKLAAEGSEAGYRKVLSKVNKRPPLPGDEIES